jgi:ATP-dependent helicase/nuclease subunit A
MRVAIRRASPRRVGDEKELMQGSFMRLTETFQKFSDSQKQALDARRNLAVRANAGSGKTSVLVERIAQILAQSWDDGRSLELTKIVAITFTRKAAAELEDRLRLTFREMSRLSGDPKEKDFWTKRIEELPRSMIGTIDSFCARILREFGLLDDSPDRIEPDFQPVEGHEAEQLKREAVDRTINQLASGASHGSDSSSENDLAEACQWWAEHEGYQTLTYHLMELLGHAVEPLKIVAAHRNLPSATERVRADWENSPAIQAWKKNRIELVEQILVIVRKTEGREKTNIARVRDPLQQALQAFRKSDPDSINEGLAFLRSALFTGSDTQRSTRVLKEIESEMDSLQEKWCPVLESFEFDFEGEVRALEAADRLALLLEQTHREYLQLCRESNQYDFWTIARRTRDLLGDNPNIRRELKERYRFIMVDEFQDTNQLQWEIISWLAGAGPEGELEKDRLFIVGDPQQSIYRFRKADVKVFVRVQEKIMAANQNHGLDQLPTAYDDHKREPISHIEQRLGFIPLRENYRSLNPIPLALMDRVFQHAFDPTIQGIDPQRDRFEIEYQNLVPGAKCKAAGEIRYVVIGEPEGDPVNETEGDESATTEDLPTWQVQAVLDQLESLLGQPKHIVKDGESNTLSWKDMAILLPSRDVVLGRLEKELARRRIPYVVTSGIGFWQRQEIRDIVSLACFLADSGDELALFALLRGPLGQLSDQEILFLSQLGRGSIHRGLRHFPDPEAIDLSSLAKDDEAWSKLSAPIRQALEGLWQGLDRRRIRTIAVQIDSWRQRVDRMAHADFLQRCLEESGAYAIYAAEPEGELILANLRRLFDLIRAEEKRSAPGLGRLARWMRDQVDDSLKEEQAVLAAGQDAIQIMTVHGAKGLEFPVVAVLKMERQADRPRPRWLLVKSESDRLLEGDEKDFPSIRPGTLSVSVRHPQRPRETYTPRLLRALRNLEQAQDLAESRRLFYVAATRARERLILSGKQWAPKKDGTPRELPTSWQRWFEEALGINEEHKQKGSWPDAANGWGMKIVTDPAPSTERKSASLPQKHERIDLKYLHERSHSPSLATTGLETMREAWSRNPDEWRLFYRFKVRPHMQKANSKLEIRNSNKEMMVGELETGESSLGMVIGTMVHRMFEMGPKAFEKPGTNRKQLLEAMAANVLAARQTQENRDETEESRGVDSKIVDMVVSRVEDILERIRGAEYYDIRRLLEKPGQPEVEFLLPLGRWHIKGRFDKLLAHSDGGWEIVDWKTDQADPKEIVKRYGEQMKIYALALYRAGKAALVDGAIRVHLALLHHGRVESLRFTPEELDDHAGLLEKELRLMDEFADR